MQVIREEGCSQDVGAKKTRQKRLAASHQKKLCREEMIHGANGRVVRGGAIARHREASHEKGMMGESEEARGEAKQKSAQDKECNSTREGGGQCSQTHG